MLKFLRDLPYLISQVRFSVLLAACIIPLGEVHKAWASTYKEVDVFLFKDYRLDIEWVVYHVCEMLQKIIMSWLLYRFSCIGRVDKVLCRIFLALHILCWADLFMYFCNFRTGAYEWIYYGLACLMILWSTRKTHPKKA